MIRQNSSKCQSLKKRGEEEKEKEKEKERKGREGGGESMR